MIKHNPPSPEPLHRAIARFGDVAVLVVGDIILDRFVNGVIERISPEAPIPVLHGRGESSAMGGAGNVVANIVSLGARAIPVSVIGTDPAGDSLVRMLGELGAETVGLSQQRGRMTSSKSRFSALNQQVLRFDEEEIKPLGEAERAELIRRFRNALQQADIVILSDYGKGILLDGVAAELIAICREAGKPVLVDPKGRDYARYSGATAVTPNRKELGEAVGHAVFADDEIVAAARELIAAHGFDFVVATRSEKGMSVVGPDEARHIATQAREVFDVSGAGDTVIATFALALAAGADPVAAASIANAAGGVVVGKRGTARLSVEELTGALFRSHGPTAHKDAILDATSAARMVAGWKAEGLSVGFTNGCFDILHAGHVSLLHAARSQCDRLVLGLNSDASVRRLKGPGRPVNDQHDRACVLAALASVDAVIVFDEDTPLALIEALLPDILVKGADYTIDTVVGADVVQKAGGRVVLVDLVAGKSTTGTIGKLRAGGATN
ncbi:MULTISPECIES: D-glycero-beta-D-manno-heptose-7-phosphate kinase [unclassified Mesorhizobium]|uniref:D-glycero-beta-D-manno-heptose-7-phosphate kinase n=1 Tax=unclassified Mesorhizobium TaxID=325217 RepID=UPI001128EDDB|nr:MULTISPECIES: D-glycero-beta-D-manno-heptose-7-phosphate kinase [unclassified Mesorhizobium]MBZ9697760.1 D-glycero-beta-D-manno-heptose-7-phosphate kinase [Mesorhizobium sp. CO1-1-9]TPK16396.1 D-glycero-beta-D-manno-heptose-7-phosphate kinase [Mesorhizobium sp. B2-5-7]